MLVSRPLTTWPIAVELSAEPQGKASALLGFLTLCRPCTKVAACFNDCQNCELCIGKPTLPPELQLSCDASGDGVYDLLELSEDR